MNKIINSFIYASSSFLAFICLIHDIGVFFDVLYGNINLEYFYIIRILNDSFILVALWLFRSRVLNYQRDARKKISGTEQC